MSTAYVTTGELTAYGVTGGTDPLIAAAQRVVDRYVTFPLNGDGSKFPRLQGDYYGNAVLSAPMTNVAASLTLTDVVVNDLAWYPTGPHIIMVEFELMQATSRAAGTISGLTRGFSGTDAAAHAAGCLVRWAVVPQGVKDAVCEQVAWLLQEGTTHQRLGGNDSLMASTLGATKMKARVDAPMLAPMARLMLKPYMQRTGSIVPGLRAY